VVEPSAFDYLNGLIVPLLIVLLIAVPSVRLLRRVGLSSWYALILLFPVLGAIGFLYFVAYAPWPADIRKPITAK
jgi:uncharacterized membrane protein YhaH (DUF805 family)